MAKPTIFISHISREGKLADQLKKQLTKDFLGMIDVFVSSDDKSIQLGDSWLKRVEETLKEAEIMIILCSKDSVQRPWVNFEAGMGWLRGISIVPVCHTDMKPVTLPLPLQLLQGIEAGDAAGIKKLYEMIAGKLGSDLPKTDFKKISNGIKEIEKTYMDAKVAEIGASGMPAATGISSAVKRILKPKILCVSSPQFDQLGFEKDTDTIEGFFPGALTVERNLTSKQFREVLKDQKFDILHLVTYVAKNGDLVFSDIEEGDAFLSKADIILADGFAKLVEMSGISLVVLASCDSLALAAVLNRKVNIIAAMDAVEIDAVVAWEDCFYGFLAKGFSVIKAYELTKSLYPLPMLLIPAVDIAYAEEK